MGLLDQSTQLRSSRTYDDTIAANALVPAVAANQHMEYDLNALRSQLARILGASWVTPPSTPLSVVADTAFVMAMSGM